MLHREETQGNLHRGKGSFCGGLGRHADASSGAACALPFLLAVHHVVGGLDERQPEITAGTPSTGTPSTPHLLLVARHVIAEASAQLANHCLAEALARARERPQVAGAGAPLAAVLAHLPSSGIASQRGEELQD
eukprot:scaffold8615_cov61-Phaeocystis_antarctica.AAC.4